MLGRVYSLYSADASVRQPHFDAARMKGRIGEQILYDTVRKGSSSLISF